MSENSDILDELETIVGTLDRLSERVLEEKINQPTEALKNAAEEVGRASSGSWLGYHANVYHVGFAPPPPGHHFSPEWGLLQRHFVTGTTGHWLEHNPEDVKEIIHKRAGNPCLAPARAFAIEAREAFLNSQRNIISILEIASVNSDSPLLTDIKAKSSDLAPSAPSEIVQLLAPQQNMSRDTTAIFQGKRVPPHISVFAEVIAIGHTIEVIAQLANLARQASTHISRQRSQGQTSSNAGTKIFIGHGRSRIWLELKDFIKDQLGLPIEEFNRVPVAGTSITDRLMEMLDSATFAFLVMTGEDEQATGEMRPRENVVHEAGLFQGHLGLKRAIVLLEDGCEKFSNNAGLEHINFPENNIRAAFQDVREVLEREGFKP